MKAEKTILNEEQVENLLWKISQKEARQRKALTIPDVIRMAAKVGYKQAREEMNLRTASLADLLLAKRKEGIQEAVEWIKDYGLNEYYWKDELGICIPDKLWQAQLKKWGIE